MGLLRKLFGPSLDELVELELKLKHKREILQESEATYLAESIEKAEAEERNSFSKIGNVESITTKLIAYTSEESQGNLAFKSIHDKVSFDYDSDIGVYIIADEYGETLGRFSKSVSEKIKQKKTDCELLGFIKSVGINHETDQYTADIIIYFV